ncbi:5-formyltetrahydrofolate cyclo-ligase [Oecophyllibacter saccharovorans]|nr:5-formyltetrahydrofolate cyclo-ligase [Oecophyllibacter saccharovorans]
MVAPLLHFSSQPNPTRTSFRESALAHSEIEARKAVLRRSLLLNRIAPLPSVNRRIVTTLTTLIYRSQARNVACVWPLPGEVDLRPLCRALWRLGRQICLPETPPRGQPLRFRRWYPGVSLRKGLFGTVYPAAPLCRPDLILVPVVGFDRCGGRLGYGGGYYDRTLARYRDLPAIGYAQASQEVTAVPAGRHDQPLSCLATEREVLHFPS